MKLIKPTQINEYQESKYDRIIETVFIVGLSLILLILSILILATTSHAAGNSAIEYPLPYVVSNENVSGLTSFIDLLSHTNSEYAQYATRYVNGDSYFGYDFYESGVHKFALYFPESNFQYSFSLSVNYDAFDYTNNRAEMTFSGYSYIKGYVEQYGSRYYFYGTHQENVSSSTTVSFFNGSNKGDGSILVPNISTDNYVYNDDQYKVVFGFGNPTPPLIPTGHATEPDFDDNNNINTDGHAQQPQDPTFPIFVAPNIDTTNLESLVSSLINFVKEFADYVGECFSIFFSWLVDVIKNAFQSVINTIREAVNFLYENFVTLFESIAESVNYIIEPLDVNEVHSALVATDVYSVPSSFISFTDDFDDVFDIQEPDTFTITIHVEDVSLLNQSNPYVLNLGSQFYPIRSALRTFLWILVTFASVIFVEHNLSSWLKGSGEEK